jgi:hypothetical protein
MESYVVRIYRRGGRRSRILVGTVEEAGARSKMAFSNIEELRSCGKSSCAGEAGIIASLLAHDAEHGRR